MKTILMKKQTLLLILTVVLLVLSGCSPHPGTGTWLPVEGGTTEFSRITVNFDGRAELYTPASEKEVLRCFWGGESSQSMQLKCSLAADTDVEYLYQLKVNQSGEAELILSGKTLGIFYKKPE